MENLEVLEVYTYRNVGEVDLSNLKRLEKLRISLLNEISIKVPRSIKAITIRAKAFAVLNVDDLVNLEQISLVGVAGLSSELFSLPPKLRNISVSSDMDDAVVRAGVNARKDAATIGVFGR